MHLLSPKLFVLSSFFLLTGFAFAKTGPISVEANENTTVSLFFPSSIDKVIKPASHFSFTHEPFGNLATLKARKGNPSNLTVITENGDIFSFALNYSETIQNFTYIISSEQSIGRRRATLIRPDKAFKDRTVLREAGNNPIKKSTNVDYQEVEPKIQADFSQAHKTSETDNADVEAINALSEDSFIEQGSFYDMDREGYYEIFCENSYRQRTIDKNNMSDNGGVDLRLNHIAIDHDEIYFTLQFRNVSKSDYQIGKVQFYIQTLGSEELSMSPLYIYNLGGVIKQSGVNKFVYVFKDFSLGTDQKVYVVMDEKKGHRNIMLPLDMVELRKNLE